MSTADRRFALYRPLRIGTRVRSKTWRKGATGYVKEILGNSKTDAMDGLRKYGVILDADRMCNVSDFCRHELVVIPKNSTPKGWKS